MKMTRPLSRWSGLAAAALLLAGCDHARIDSQPTGDVGFALQIAPGVSITSASYAIVGRTGFTSSGSVAVGNSADVPVPVSGLPVGTGYTITVVASAGITMCRGVAVFDVIAGSNAAVIVHLVCREPPRTGSIGLTGLINVCPILDGLGASPDRVQVGGTSALTSSATDADNGPGPLAFQWTASSGSFSNATAASPTFTCTQAGTVTVSVKASDGDPDPTCADSLTVTVLCEAAQ
jgi:hypothetical protein